MCSTTVIIPDDPQIYNKLQETIEGSGWSGMLRRATNIPNHIMIAHSAKRKWTHAKCFDHFKTVSTLQGTWRTLPEYAEYTYSSHRFLHGFSILILP